MKRTTARSRAPASAGGPSASTASDIMTSLIGVDLLPSEPSLTLNPQPSRGLSPATSSL